uniref:Putative CENPB/ARS binding proteinlike protein n=1 Tax=Albugo laibachii Nc14 TaxID=890382 RepID=F0WYK8_9STRA|nr:putative CENPB/ARS binding proteinlike protein [Albugo laibachii Nc14]|eukprot:CCA26566.1 putative CENPB/ARS binding proteinlike protein [Albugo laibachii Nc14]
MPSRPNATGNLTFEQKKKICLWNEENAALTQLQLAAMAMREFNLVKAPVQGTISGILHDRKKYLLLANWVMHCQSKRVILSGDLIKAKAKRFATLSGVQDDQLLSFSNGWLQAFHNRHSFRHMSAHGESGSVNTGAIPAQRDAIREHLKGVSLAEIDNMDETGLFYCLETDKIIVRRQVEGSMKSNPSVTIALTCNADGSDKF